MRPGRASCAECRDLYDGAPPCSQCEKPIRPLTAPGKSAVEAWRLLHAHDRELWPMDGTPLNLRLRDIRGLCADYRLSLETKELIIALDRKMTGMLQEEWRKKSKAG